MNHYQYILWDWNGTLIDDTGTCFEILCTILETYGKAPTTYDTYLRDFRFPIKAYYEGLGFDFSIESYDAIANDFITEYRKRQYNCDLHTYVKAILHTLHNQGQTQFILSAFNQGMLEEAVTFFNIDQYFSGIVGQQDLYANSKIESGRKLMRQFKLAPDQGLMIGDTTHDYEVAQDIGVDCLLISDGHQARETLDACGVTVLDSLGEVLAWLDGR